MDRIEALASFTKSFQGKKLSERISESQFDEIVYFIDENDHLDHLQFEYKVNRMFMDKPKPKGWVEMMEIILSVNTRAKSKNLD